MAADAPSVPARALTVLFADMSGSVHLYAARGDVVAYRLNAACLDLLIAQVREHQGRLVRTLGDGLLAVFDASEDAVRAASAMQHAMHNPACPLQSEGVRVRAGISCGPVVVAEHDIFGDVVNVAARLTSIAGPDEIVLSGAVYEALPDDLRQAIRLIDHLTLRGRPHPLLVYQYLWKRDDTTVGLGQRVLGPTTTIELRYQALLFVVGPERPKLTIGRAPDNDIAIEKDVVSRHHATVVQRGERFVLTDTSTNGTWVQPDTGESFRTLRDEVTLSGSGRLLPGNDAQEAIAYRLLAH